MRGNDTCDGIRFFCKTNTDDGYGRTSEKWLV